MRTNKKSSAAVNENQTKRQRKHKKILDKSISKDFDMRKPPRRFTAEAGREERPGEKGGGDRE